MCEVIQGVRTCAILNHAALFFILLPVQFNIPFVNYTRCRSLALTKRSGLLDSRTVLKLHYSRFLELIMCYDLFLQSAEGSTLKSGLCVQEPTEPKGTLQRFSALSRSSTSVEFVRLPQTGILTGFAKLWRETENLFLQFYFVLTVLWHWRYTVGRYSQTQTTVYLKWQIMQIKRFIFNEYLRLKNPT